MEAGQVTLIKVSSQSSGCTSVCQDFWAARCISRLLAEVMPQGVVFSVRFLCLSRLYVYPQALSYYKIFGYPTGLGALLVHKRALPLLLKKKRYFGGGTVAVSLAEEDFFRSAALGIDIYTHT